MMKRLRPSSGGAWAKSATATRALYHGTDEQTVLLAFALVDEELEIELSTREARNLKEQLRASLSAIDQHN